MSALPLKVDIAESDWHVRFGRNILPRHSQPTWFLFAPDRVGQTRLSYFVARIDIAPSNGEIDDPVIIDRATE